MANKYLGEAEQCLIIPRLIVQVEDKPDLPTFPLWWQSRARGGKMLPAYLANEKVYKSMLGLMGQRGLHVCGFQAPTLLRCLEHFGNEQSDWQKRWNHSRVAPTWSRSACHHAYMKQLGLLAL